MPFATPISGHNRRRVVSIPARHWLLLALAFVVAAGLVWAVQGRFSDLAVAQFQKAEAHFVRHPQDAEAAWQFGRACFDLAEFSTNSTERAALAERGIAACRALVDRDPKSVPGRYYLGMNLGQLARTRTLGALKLVKEMELEFGQAADTDPRFDHAGPERNLGMLYRDAPVIGSIGSRTKAREHLKRAVSLAPDYPENRLALAEAYLKWGERPAARSEVETLEKNLESAKKQFAGPEWGSSWADWDQRLADLDKKLSLPARLNAPK